LFAAGAICGNPVKYIVKEKKKELKMSTIYFIAGFC
jgi:hypothetical protein